MSRREAAPVAVLILLLGTGFVVDLWMSPLEPRETPASRPMASPPVGGMFLRDPNVSVVSPLENPTAPESTRTGIQQWLDVRGRAGGPAKRGDWVLLVGKASPAGALAGFRLQVEEGAWSPKTPESTRAQLALEVVPLTEPGAPHVQEWLLLPLVLEDGRPGPVFWPEFDYSPGYYEPPYIHEAPRRERTEDVTGVRIPCALPTMGRGS